MTNKLREIRVSKWLRQEYVAKEVGLSQSMLSMMENGAKSGSDKTKIALAKFYGVSVEDIFFADNYHL